MKAEVTQSYTGKAQSCTEKTQSFSVCSLRNKETVLCKSYPVWSFMCLSKFCYT